MFAVQATAVLATLGVRPTARAQLASGSTSASTSSGSVGFALPPASKAPRSTTLRARAGPRSDNPNFNPNDPMTWNLPADGGADDAGGFLDFGAPVEDLMQLDDAQLAQLLGVEGAAVPMMLEDGGIDTTAGAASGDEDVTPPTPSELPASTAAQAIDKGLALYRAEEYPKALAVFIAALDLPGTGPIRRRKAKVMAAGPSLGYADADASLNEQIAIHYNCACCHARLEDPQAGLVSLVRAMEAGYDDYDNIRVDADIALLRSDERFEGLMARFEPSGFISGVFAAMQKGTTRDQAKKGGAPRGGGGGELIGGFIDAVKSSMDKSVDSK